MNLPDLEDAALDTLIFDWDTRTVTVIFIGSRAHAGRFSLTFLGVTQTSIPSKLDRGSSSAVMRFRDCGLGRHEIALRSGDTISVTSEGEPVLRDGPVVRQNQTKH